jgi:VIT1/CCC1 family predicted Fe2+/Mn2+ transporter
LRAWIGSRILAFRGLLSVHSRYGLHARGVAYVTLSIEGFSDFVSSIAAPIATGWNDSCRAGIAPAEDARLFTAHQNRWVDFMMRFELGLEEPNPNRARFSALTIAFSYIVGGLIPLAPYFIVPSVHRALIVSVLVTGFALALFGYIKGRFTGKRPLRSAWQTVAVGGLAAAAAFALSKLLG